MRYSGSASAFSISSRVSWPFWIGFTPMMPPSTSPSATPCTSSGCRPQKAAIWSKLSAVLSTSQTAVALGIRRVVAMIKLAFRWRPGFTGAPRLSAFSKKGISAIYGPGVRFSTKSGVCPKISDQHDLTVVAALARGAMGVGGLGEREVADFGVRKARRADRGPEAVAHLAGDGGLGLGRLRAKARG